MQKEKKKADYPKKTKKVGFDSASLLFSGLSVLLVTIGLYLNLQNNSAVGITQPNRYGQGGGSVVNMSGMFVIALGIFFAAFPIIDLIRYLRNRH